MSVLITRAVNIFLQKGVVYLLLASDDFAETIPIGGKSLPVGGGMCSWALFSCIVSFGGASDTHLAYQFNVSGNDTCTHLLGTLL